MTTNTALETKANQPARRDRRREFRAPRLELVSTVRDREVKLSEADAEAREIESFIAEVEALKAEDPWLEYERWGRRIVWSAMLLVLLIDVGVTFGPSIFGWR